MKTSLPRKTFMSNRNSKSSMFLSKKTKRNNYVSDDFLNWIYTMKERGDVSISGKRIC